MSVASAPASPPSSAVRRERHPYDSLPATLKHRRASSSSVHRSPSKPSPLTRQMSLSSDPSIDPNRTHSQGPLAVLYSAPERDILSLQPQLHPSPTRNNSASDAARPLEPPSNASPGRRFNDLARGLSSNALSQSPSRSLLAAFQAVSPRSTIHSVGLRNAGPAQPTTSLQPASPISSPQGVSARFDTLAFRHLNGASVPAAGTEGTTATTGSRSRSNSSSSARPMQQGTSSPRLIHQVSDEEPSEWFFASAHRSASLTTSVRWKTASLMSVVWDDSLANLSRSGPCARKRPCWRRFQDDASDRGA